MKSSLGETSEANEAARNELTNPQIRWSKSYKFRWGNLFGRQKILKKFIEQCGRRRSKFVTFFKNTPKFLKILRTERHLVPGKSLQNAPNIQFLFPLFTDDWQPWQRRPYDAGLVEKQYSPVAVRCLFWPCTCHCVQRFTTLSPYFFFSALKISFSR